MKTARLMRFSLVLLVTLLALAPHTARAAATATLYSVTDLGALGGTFSVALALNNRGQVVGTTSLPGDSNFHAFLWEEGEMTDLGTLGGPNSVAFGINASGQVAGYSDTTHPGGRSPFCATPAACHAAQWDKGVITDLGTLGGNNSGMNADGIDNKQQVAGFAENTVIDPTSPPLTPTLEYHAAQWDKGVITDLGTLGGPDSVASGINNRGQVAGFSMFNTVIDPQIGSPDVHAFLWSKESMTDLGTLGGPQSQASGINNKGQVVGGADTTIPDPSTTCAGLPANALPEYHPALWQHGTVTDLTPFPGDPDGFANANNNRGQVVGGSGTFCSSRAVLWQNGEEDHEGVIDLNTVIPANSGWVLLSGNGINARGEIVGFGMHNGQNHAFLLTPNRGEGEATPARSTVELQAMVAPALATLPANVQGLMRWPTRALGGIR